MEQSVSQLERKTQRVSPCDMDGWAIDKLGELRSLADEIIMRYYAQVMTAAKEHPGEDAGMVGVRTRNQRGPRARAGTFTIEWVKYRYVNRDLGAGSKAFTYYVKRGDSMRYPRTAFRKLAPLWQQQLIDAAEEQFAKIRTLAASIGKLRAQMHQFERQERRMMQLLAHSSGSARIG